MYTSDFSSPSDDNQTPALTREEKNRMRHKFQTGIVIAESDLNKLVTEKTRLDVEVRKLKKETDQIKINLKQKKERLDKLNFETLQKEQEIKKLKKSLYAI